VNRGFADLRVEPLHHVAPCDGRTHRDDQSIVAAPRGFEPRFTDSKSAVLPLDEGAAGGDLERTRALPGPGMPPRAEKWSGRRDSNPRPSPWQGDALPTEPLPLDARDHRRNDGAESQDRTGDTAIFSRVLYQLSYLGPMANQARSPVGAGENTTGLRRPSNRPRRGPSIESRPTGACDEFPGPAAVSSPKGEAGVDSCSPGGTNVHVRSSSRRDLPRRPARRAFGRPAPPPGLPLPCPVPAPDHLRDRPARG
jgi:hypothetical protein